MSPTLRTMLSMGEVAVGAPEVLAGTDRLDEPVRWGHVTEIDDVRDLLEGHEVVLTTGLPLMGSAARSAHFLAQLDAARSCGLVIELGSALPEVPRAVVEEAERLHLPLIALHQPVRFVALTEAVHRVIVGEQYQDLEFARRTHEVFTTLSLESADSTTILHEAAELVDGPVVLEDLGHKVLALAPHHDDTGELLGSWDERSRRTPMLDELGVTGPEDWLICPVGLGGSPWGRLVSPSSAHESRAAIVLQRAAQALQISRLVERDTTSLHFQAQESLLQELLDGRVRDESAAISRAQALGLPSAAQYLPVVVQFPSVQHADQIARQQRARSQLDAVARGLRDAKVDGFAGGVADDCVGLVLAIPPSKNEDPIMRRLASAMVDSPSGGTEHRRPVLGVGKASGSLVTAASRIRSTIHIARAARALPVSAVPYFRSTDVRLRGLVAQLQDDERLIAFSESELAPLLARDSREGAALLELIRLYVSLRGNKTAIARAAGLSRPGLYSKLRTIESILVIDLEDADSLLSLGVALLVHDMRDETDG